MSVQTTADDKLDSASNHIDAAIKDLFAVAIEKCHGHDDYKEGYIETVHEVLMDLMAIKKKWSR